MRHVQRSFVPTVPLDEAEVAVLGVPFDGTAVAHPLQRYGPTLVRSALRHVNRYQPRSGARLTEQVHDVGDVTPAPAWPEMDRRVRETLAEIQQANPEALPALIGGEHTISLSAVRELEPATIVAFDAHTDLWDTFEGVEECHATWLRRAWEEIDPQIALIGARAWPEELEATLDEVDPMTSLSSGLEGPVYVSVDVDVFDPAHAPEVGFPEPGGMRPQEVFDLLASVFRGNEVCGFDVVEVASDELGSVTANLAAQTFVRGLAAAT